MKHATALRSLVSLFLALIVVAGVGILPVSANSAYFPLGTNSADALSPSVTSILLVNPSPNNLASVNYTVTFSEDVTGVDVSDFTLTKTGAISGESVTSVSGGPASYTVTVNSGTGDGTLRLDLPGTATVNDLEANPLIDLPYISGAVYTIEKTLPTVVSSVRVTASPSNAASVDFTVTFSESVTGVAASDFTLTKTGALSGESVTSVSGGPASYIVTVNSGTGDGTLRLDLSGTATVTDLVGNALTAPFTSGESYTISRIAPIVDSSCRVTDSPSKAASVEFTVTFSENVTGVDAGDFTLYKANTVSGESVMSVSGGPAIYTVTVNTGTGNGDLRLDLPTTATITDLDGNPLAGLPFNIGGVYNMDRTEPALVSSARAGTSPTNAAIVDFTVTFSEFVTGVDPSDFVSGTSVTGGPVTYTVSVSTPTGENDLRLTLPLGAVINDAAGNLLSGLPIMIGEVYHVDNAAPTVVSSVRANFSPTHTPSVGFTVTFSEPVTGVAASDFILIKTGAISGESVTSVSGGPTIYTVTVSIGAGAGTLRLEVPVTATVNDLIGNPLTGLPHTTGETYTTEALRAEPTVVSSMPAKFNGSFIVMFSEPVMGVEINDFELIKKGDISGARITSVACVDKTCTVEVYTGTGEGSLRLDVPASATITNMLGTPVAKLPYTFGKFNMIYDLDIRSTGLSDGWLLESLQGSNVGGSANSTATTFVLGDDVLNRQYRTILHFPTYYLPDDAGIIQADLMLKKESELGTTAAFGDISVDIRNRLFLSYNDGGFAALQPATFQAQADASSVGTNPWNHNIFGWYWTTLNRNAFTFINPTGGTQLRLGFTVKTNMNGVPDFVRFFSGDNEEQKDRPHLMIRYGVTP